MVSVSGAEYQNTPEAVGMRKLSDETRQALFISEPNSPFFEAAELINHVSQIHKYVYMYI